MPEWQKPIEEIKLQLSAHTSSGAKVEVRRPRTTLKLSPIRQAAEAFFKTMPAKDDVVQAPTSAKVATVDVATPPIPPVTVHAAMAGDGTESDHRKVFRLIGEGEFRAASRLAKRLIDAGDVEGFFIYRDTPKLRLARAWLDTEVKNAEFTEQAGWHKITPERAQVLIEANVENRKINADGLEERMRDMKDGAWKKNGESLIVSRCKHLNDGQHRSWSALLLGMPFTTAMSFGVERDTRDSINTGVIRKGADRLGFDRVSNPAAKTAVARLAHQLAEGRLPTKREEQEYYHTHKMLIERSFDVVKSTLRGSSASQFRVAAMDLVRMGAKDADISEFLRLVRLGKQTRERGCPVFALYKEIAVTKGKHPAPVWVAAICEHFLAWSNGKQLGTFAKVKVA